MIFTWYISVPANTSVDAPVEDTLELSAGIIKRVRILWPPGSAGLGGCRIYQYGHQLFPTRSDQYFKGDTFPIEWDEDYELETKPYDLRVACWNDDDTYPHEVQIAIALLPVEKSLGYIITKALKDIVSALSVKTIFKSK